MKLRTFLFSLLLIVPMLATAQSDPKKPSPEEQIDGLMAHMTEALTLDSFQQAVIKNAMLVQMTKVDGLRSDSDFNSVEKQAKAREVVEKTDAEINAVLNAEQKEKYKEFKEKMRKGKISGKPKKKKKETEE